MTEVKLCKEKKKVCGIFLIVIALIIMQLPVAEADAATSASDFKIEGSTLVKYRGTEKNVSVPDTVKTIGEGAFEGNTDIELVVLPKSVQKIEAYAFWGCNSLDTVVIGKGLKEVGDYAFANCKGLKQMSIPTNVNSMGIQAFADCVNMEDISIPPEVTSIHDTAFNGCYKLTIHCEAGSVADRFAEDFYEKQKEMPEYEDAPSYQPENPAGENGGGSNVGEDVTTTPVSPAGTDTAAGNVLGSTQVVGNQAVIFIDTTSPVVYGMEPPQKQLQEEPGDTATIGTAAEIGDGSEIFKYTIVDERSVADQAYYRRMDLRSIVLTDGIEEIGQFAFARSSVSGITIPDGVKDICYGAFYHCDSLAEVILPDTVRMVEPKAFTYTAWVENFLENGNSDFLISGGVLAAYKGNDAQVNIPEGVRVIGGEAFLDHDEITSVILPDTLISVGEGAFQGCSGLAELRFGSRSVLEELKDRAFVGCGLESVTLPDSVKTMGIGVFDEAVRIMYDGGFQPEITYEVSAQRLSNESYRNCGEEEQAPGVTVVGLENASASLEGAARAYTLSVKIGGGKELLQKAYERAFASGLPEKAVVYDLQLYDNSEIPLTKLGKQLLTVTLPVPAALAGEEIQIYMVDRNGQLEAAAGERIMVDGVESIRFSVNQISPVGLCGNGQPFDSGELLEETVDIVSMSAPENGTGRLSMIKTFTGATLLFAGMLLLIVRTKKKNGN